MMTTRVQASSETASQKRLPTPFLKNKTDTIAQKTLIQASPSPVKRSRPDFEYDFPVSPLSPVLSPNARIAKVAFPVSPPSTPRKGTSRNVTPLPPTPIKHPSKRVKGEHAGLNGNSHKTAESFGKELPVALVKISPIALLQSKISMPLIGRMYTSPTGQNIAVIQQPVPEKPTCGPGCVLMIGLTNMEKLVNSEKFWNWYSTTRISNGKSLLNGFRHLEIHAKVCKMIDASMNIQSPNLENPDIERKLLDPKAAVSFISETIETTGNPVILAITHPIVKGHWIIVDGFHNECALIRDPYTGKAFALPAKTLSKWLLEKDQIQEMVYFPRA